MKTILKYDLEGNFLEQVDCETLLAVSKKEGVNYQSLSDHLKGRFVSCGGFQYKAKRSDRILEKIGDVSNIKRGAKEVPISKYYKGNYICSYTSLLEAADRNNIASQNISKSLKDTSKVNGFQFFHLKP